MGLKPSVPSVICQSEQAKHEFYELLSTEKPPPPPPKLKPVVSLTHTPLTSFQMHNKLLGI
jgi:hypothetical protein